MKSKNQKKSSKWITSNPTPWFTTYEVLEYLGISDKELNQHLELFTEGIHFRREIPSDKASPILWRIDLIDELLSLPIPPLEKEAMLKAINNHITCHI